MSDFDKEAERERLREKYGRDEEDRKATQRMSDLLLKGARMTSTHCGTCGDPLFEQEGTTFCPSCHGGPEGVEATLETDDEEASPDATSRPAEPDRAADTAPDPAPRQPPEPAAESPLDGADTAGTPKGDLRRALARFAAAGADAEDPRQAREYLAAAREAASALAALRGSP